VNRGSARRRLRLRRKRKGEIFSKILDVPDVVDLVDVAGGVDVSGIVDAVDGGAVADVAEVVGHMGCCVVEAVGAMAVLLALLTVPAYLLMN
jgi:hypothetical protein